MTTLFSNSSPQIPKSGIFVSNLRIFIFAPNFAIRQIQKRWFQIWQDFFQILAQKYQNEAFLVPNLGIFIISQNFAIRQIWECGFKIWQYCFQIPVPKYQFRHFCIKFKDFYFCIKLFNYLVKNTQIRHFWSQI